MQGEQGVVAYVMLPPKHDLVFVIRTNYVKQDHAEHHMSCVLRPDHARRAGCGGPCEAATSA